MMRRESEKALVSVMNKYLCFKRKLGPVSDGQGGFIEQYGEDKYFWGSLDPISEKRKFEYKTVNVEATHYVKVRAIIKQQLTGNMVNDYQIYFFGREFEIVSGADIQERGIVLLLVCKEVF